MTDTLTLILNILSFLSTFLIKIQFNSIETTIYAHVLCNLHISRCHLILRKHASQGYDMHKVHSCVNYVQWYYVLMLP